MKRKLVKSYGVRGNRRANIYKAGTRYVVERYLDGKPRRETFADLASATAYATAYANASATTAAPLTLRQGFDRFLATESAKHNWSLATRTDYATNRKRIEEALGPDILVTTIGRAHLDQMWLQLRVTIGMAHMQVCKKVNLLKRLMTWLNDRDLATNRLASWKSPKGAKTKIAEYQPADTDKLLAHWDYQENGWTWRPWAVTMIAASHGFRINALLHLRWDDVDWATARVRLRAETDKTRRTWSRQLTWDAWSALLTARYHATRLDKASPWVFYGNGTSGKPWTYGAYHIALGKAEEAVGVAHVKGRAAHGFRRQAVNDARKATGDAALAMLWVGDTDMRSAASYVRTREEELDVLANRGAE